MATEFAKTVMREAPIMVAAGAVALTTAEPVCKLVRGVWEKHVLKVDETTSQGRYKEIEKKTLAECDAKEKVTKVATTVNEHRPYAGADVPKLVTGFLLGVVVLRSFK